MKIAAIDAIPLNMTFRPEVAPHMLRATTHGTLLTLYRVRLENGATGYGDMMGDRLMHQPGSARMRWWPCARSGTAGCRWPVTMLWAVRLVFRSMF